MRVIQLSIVKSNGAPYYLTNSFVPPLVRISNIYFLQSQAPDIYSCLSNNQHNFRSKHNVYFLGFWNRQKLSCGLSQIRQMGHQVDRKIKVTFRGVQPKSQPQWDWEAEIKLSGVTRWLSIEPR